MYFGALLLDACMFITVFIPVLSFYQCQVYGHRVVHNVNFKTSVILLAKNGFVWIGENCNLEHASNGKTIGDPRKQNQARTAFL